MGRLVAFDSMTSDFRSNSRRAIKPRNHRLSCAGECFSAGSRRCRNRPPRPLQCREGIQSSLVAGSEDGELAVHGADFRLLASADLLLSLWSMSRRRTTGLFERCEERTNVGSAQR
jgi:hypothetical protein